MHDPMTFQARLAEAYGRYADERTRMSPRSTWPQGSRRGRLCLPRLTSLVAGPRCAPLCYFPCLQWLPEVSQ